MTYGFETTHDGLEYHIGVNHVAHAYLTQLLTPQLQASVPSRVVAVSSMAHGGSYEQGMVFDEWIPQDAKMPSTYEDGNAYGQSKLANLMFIRELAARFNGTGVTAYSLHPGIIHTDLSRYMDPILQEQLAAQGWLESKMTAVFMGIFRSSMMDSKIGAYNQLYLATADAETLVNGGYYDPVGKHMTAPLHPQGTNHTLQVQLWEETERVIAQIAGAGGTADEATSDT